MIYFTTFILTLILSRIARATPACGDVTPPEELYDLTYADNADGQHALPILLYNVTWSSVYDNKNGDTNGVSCNTGPHGLALQYPHFKNFPHFPYIGAAWNVKFGSPNCGSCWTLTNVRNHKSIRLTVINNAKPDRYEISKEAFNVLHGGPGSWLEAEIRFSSPKPCHP